MSVVNESTWHRIFVLHTRKDSGLYANLVDRFGIFSCLRSTFGTRIGHRPGCPFCTVWKNNQDAVLYPDTLIYFLGYCFPLLFLILCYSLMYKQLKDYSLRAGKEGKMTKAALIMVGSYILIYTPGFVNYLFNKDISGERVSQILALVSYNTGWSHAFINPIISILFNPLYRNECLKVLKIKKEEPFRKSVFHSIRTSRTYYSPSKIELVPCVH